jgi:hypothetical protein
MIEVWNTNRDKIEKPYCNYNQDQDYKSYLRIKKGYPKTKVSGTTTSIYKKSLRNIFLLYMDEHSGSGPFWDSPSFYLLIGPLLIWVNPSFTLNIFPLTGSIPNPFNRSVCMVKYF